MNWQSWAADSFNLFTIGALEPEVIFAKKPNVYYINNISKAGNSSR